MPRTEFELDLTHGGHHDLKPENITLSNEEHDTDSKNELGPDNIDKKESAPTDAPFELDLTAHNNDASPSSPRDKSVNESLNIPDEKDNMHLRRPQDDDSDEDKSMSPDVTSDDVSNMDEKNGTVGMLAILFM